MLSLFTTWWLRHLRGFARSSYLRLQVQWFTWASTSPRLSAFLGSTCILYSRPLVSPTSSTMPLRSSSLQSKLSLASHLLRSLPRRHLVRRSWPRSRVVLLSATARQMRTTLSHARGSSSTLTSETFAGHGGLIRVLLMLWPIRVVLVPTGWRTCAFLKIGSTLSPRSCQIWMLWCSKP